MNLRLVGRVARLQIQRSPLKVGSKPQRVYDPSPLLSAPRLRVTPGGAFALLPDGQTVIDVHHRDHPQSENVGRNGISIGFTSHYAEMRARFGAHLIDGCAGENILVEAEDSPDWSDVRRGVLIRCGADGDELWLGDVIVAHPCVEFSRYALRMPQAERDSAELKAALQFLDDGVRGFYATPTNDGQPLVVSIGDQVWLPD
jgi:hypothetical protein